MTHRPIVTHSNSGTRKLITLLLPNPVNRPAGMVVHCKHIPIDRNYVVMVSGAASMVSFSAIFSSGVLKFWNVFRGISPLRRYALGYYYEKTFIIVGFGSTYSLLLDAFLECF